MTIIASYNNLQSANSAYTKLIDQGIPNNDISVATKEETSKSFSPEANVSQSATDLVADATGGTTTGAITGGALGFLVGAASIALGTTALLITGPLAAAIGGSALAANTAVGAAIGGVSGLVSALTKAGVNDEDAKMMDNNIQKGGALISVESNQDPEKVRSILKNTQPQALTSIDK